MQALGLGSVSQKQPGALAWSLWQLMHHLHLGSGSGSGSTGGPEAQFLAGEQL